METMGKKVLILGAGTDQRQMYIAARDMGFTVIGVDKNPQAYSRDLADRFLNCSIVAYNEIIDALGSEVPDCIVSPAADITSMVLYDLCEYYNLEYKPSLSSSRASADKNYFLDLASNNGVKTPLHYKISEPNDLLFYARKIGYPVIIKPLDGQGSKGVSFVDNDSALKDAFQEALAYSIGGKAVIEEYISGVHYSAEWFRENGKTVFGVVSEKINSGAPYFGITQHLIPAPLSKNLNLEVKRTLDLLCDLFEIEGGPVNFDFILANENEIYLIEMGTRLAGNGMPELVKRSFGIDTYTMNLQIVTNQPVNELKKVNFKEFSALRLINADSDGIFSGISGLEELKKHPAFADIQIFKNPGNPVRAITRSAHKVGLVIMSHPDLAILREGLSLGENIIKVAVK